MIKKIAKWVGILLLTSLLLIGFFVFSIFSQFDKLEQGQLQENFTQDTIPFRYHNTGHMVIDVKVNNSDRTYPFILDSGAGTYVFKNLTKEYSFAGNGFALSMGAVGNIYFSRIRKIPSLQIGTATFNLLNAEETALNWDCMDNLYGIIGPNVMRHLVWDIDFRKQVIILSKQLDESKRTSKAIEIPVTDSGAGHYLYTTVKFRHNRLSKEIRIDLGNAGSLSLAENLLMEDRLTFINKQVLGIGSKGLGYASNNMSLDEKYYLVDSLIFSDSEADYAINDFPIATSPDSHNFLGLGFFEKYKTTISWQDKVVILSPYDSLQNFVWKTYGFSMGFNETKNKVEVESIIEHTPASKAGLPLFSEVISINKKKMTTFQSYCEYKALKQMGDTLNIEIKQNDSIQWFKLTRALLFD